MSQAPCIKIYGKSIYQKSKPQLYRSNTCHESIHKTYITSLIRTIQATVITPINRASCSWSSHSLVAAWKYLARHSGTLWEKEKHITTQTLSPLVPCLLGLFPPAYYYHYTRVINHLAHMHCIKLKRPYSSANCYDYRKPYLTCL